MKILHVGVLILSGLVRAISEGWIAGAVLDVFPREPLPKRSPLWSLPGGDRHRPRGSLGVSQRDRRYFRG